MMDRAQFADWVREVAARLYDSPYLQKHPLAQRLIGEGHDSMARSQALRRVMLEAIRATRPPAGVPAASSDWRRHRLLELRYIEGLLPTDAMKALNVGRSQFFRDQAQALDLLVEHLWARYGASPESARPSTDGEDHRDMVHSAVARLSTQVSLSAVALDDVFERLTALLKPLAAAEGASIRCEVGEGALAVPIADRVLLRQALLHIVTGLIQSLHAASVEVTSFSEAGGIGIRIVARGCREAPVVGVSFPVAQELAAAMGASLSVRSSGSDAHSPESMVVELTWEEKKPILLVIDDNVAFVDLYHRYLAGRGWDVRGAASAREARDALHNVVPTVIMLDVLMPSEDGWETLVSLRQDESTREIPVIVCSVLEQERLAQTLGADGYLKKPVSQERLLAALSEWSPPTTQAPAP